MPSASSPEQNSSLEMVLGYRKVPSLTSPSTLRGARGQEKQGKERSGRQVRAAARVAKGRACAGSSLSQHQHPTHVTPSPSHAPLVNAPHEPSTGKALGGCADVCRGAAPARAGSVQQLAARVQAALVGGELIHGAGALAVQLLNLKLQVEGSGERGGEGLAGEGQNRTACNLCKCCGRGHGVADTRNSKALECWSPSAAAGKRGADLAHQVLAVVLAAQVHHHSLLPVLKAVPEHGQLRLLLRNLCTQAGGGTGGRDTWNAESNGEELCELWATKGVRCKAGTRAAAGRASRAFALRPSSTHLPHCRASPCPGVS